MAINNIVGLKTCGDCRIQFKVVTAFYDYMRPVRCAECGERFSCGNIHSGLYVACYIEDDGDDSISRYPKVA